MTKVHFPMDRPGGKPAAGDTAFSLSCGVVFLAWTWGWRYRAGWGEADAAAIAAGLWQALHGGRGLNEPLLYLPAAHPLFYLSWLHWPGAAAWSFEELTTRLNLAAWLAGGMNLALVARLALHFGARRYAKMAVIALASSPVFFELATYAHPIDFALLCLLAGAAVWLIHDAETRPGARAARATLAAVLFIMAMLMRADVALLLPGLAWIQAARQPDRKKAALGSVAMLGVVALGYFTACHVVFPMGSGMAAPGDVLRFILHFTQPQLVVLSALKSILDVGPGLALLVGAGLLGALWRRRISDLLAGVAWLAPVLVPYLAYPPAARHFLYAAVAAALLVPALSDALPTFTRRWAVAAGLLVVALNSVQFLPARFVRPEWDSRIRERLAHNIYVRHVTNDAWQDWERRRWETLLPQLENGSVLIGRWREMTGLMAGLCGQRRVFTIEHVGEEAGTVLSRWQWEGKSLYFLEWYPGRTLKPLPASTPRTWLVARYGAAAEAELPPHEDSLPPEGLDFIYW